VAEVHLLAFAGHCGYISRKVAADEIAKGLTMIKGKRKVLLTTMTIENM